jgi:hypothetical protein
LQTSTTPFNWQSPVDLHFADHQPLDHLSKKEKPRLAQMNKKELTVVKSFLDKELKRHNQQGFIEKDPISIPHSALRPTSKSQVFCCCFCMGQPHHHHQQMQ